MQRKTVLILLVICCALLLVCEAGKSKVGNAAAAGKKGNEAKKKKKPSSGGHTEMKTARDEDPDIIKVRGLRNAATRHGDKREFEEAIEKYREALTVMHDRVFGKGKDKVTNPKDRSLDASMHAQLLTDYGNMLIRMKQYEEAVEVLQDSAEMLQRIFGKSHPSYGLAVRSLADAHMALKQYRPAIDNYKKLRFHMERGLGKQHEGYIEANLRIGEAYKALGKLKRAVKVYQRALEDQGDELNGATRGIAEILMEMATAQVKLKDLDAAEHAAQLARDFFGLREGKRSLQCAFSLNALAGVKMHQGLIQEAYNLLEEAQSIAVAVHGASHPIAQDGQRNLEQVKKRLDDLEAQGRKEEL